MRTASRALLRALALVAAAAVAATAHGVELVAYRVEPLAIEPGPARLLDLDDRPLGPSLGGYEFCTLAAAGAGVLGEATYRVIGTGRKAEADCRTWFRRLARKQPVAAGNLSRARFARIDWRYGLGAGEYRLVPLRSVAADPLRYPLGTVLVIAELRGRSLPGGGTHDGLVLVADRREGAIGARVALFVGRSDEPGAELAGWLAEPRSVMLVAAIDAQAIAALREAHRIR